MAQKAGFARFFFRQSDNPAKPAATKFSYFVAQCHIVTNMPQPKYGNRGNWPLGPCRRDVHAQKLITWSRNGAKNGQLLSSITFALGTAIDPSP
jgi:hypothetical protein